LSFSRTTGDSPGPQTLIASSFSGSAASRFVRVHSTLKTTPAVAAGLADHPWKLQDLIGILEQIEDAQPRERGPYKKRGEDLHSN